jgi:hypothetical protein
MGGSQADMPGYACLSAIVDVPVRLRLDRFLTRREE